MRTIVGTIVAVSSFLGMVSSPAFARSCEFSYQGVVGNGLNSIGIVTEIGTSSTMFIKAGTQLSQCGAMVVSVAHNLIVIEADHLQLKLRPQGTESAATDKVTDQLAVELAKAEGDAERAYNALLEAGYAAMDANQISSEDVKKALEAETAAIESMRQNGARTGEGEDTLPIVHLQSGN